MAEEESKNDEKKELSVKDYETTVGLVNFLNECKLPIKEAVVHEDVEVFISSMNKSYKYYMTNDFNTLRKKLNSLGYFVPEPYDWRWNPYLAKEVRQKMESLGTSFSFTVTDNANYLNYHVKNNTIPLGVSLNNLKIDLKDKYLVSNKITNKYEDKILSAKKSMLQRKWTSLMYATYMNNLEFVKYLISKGVDVNYQDEDGLSALFIAVINKNKEISSNLIKAGADVNAFTFQGMNILTFAILINKNDSHTEIIKMLEKAGAEVKGLCITSKNLNEKLSFNETLNFFITQSTFGGLGNTSHIYKNTQVNGIGGLSKMTFSKIRSNTNPNYHPKKKTVFLLAIGLGLSAEQTKTLLSSAGYVIDEKNKFDTIVMDFIKKRNFNMQELEKKIV